MVLDSRNEPERVPTARAFALRVHKPWALLSFLALFLIALLRVTRSPEFNSGACESPLVKTINLTEVATGFRNTAQPSSNYKRLQRFFRNYDLEYSVIAKAIVTLMELPQPWVLSLDRTNWWGAVLGIEFRGLYAPSFGQIHFNILMLSVVHEGVGYPLMWTFLDKKGNSNTEERMDLLNRFEWEFPEVETAYLCGDREFIGKPWLTYLLLDPIIYFRLRIRETDLINDGQQQLPAKKVFAHLQPGQQKILNSRRWGGCDSGIAFGHFSRPFWGRLVYVSALRLEDGELLIVISPDSPQTAISSSN